MLRQALHSLFLSTLSLRRATCHHRHHEGRKGHFYPRSPCGERPIGAYDTRRILRISIHALLAESDLGLPVSQQGSGISIHALLAESDFALRIIRRTFTNFYPRSPCGERLPQWLPWLLQLLISIHALLAESDLADAVQQTGETISIHALLAESDLSCS